MKYLLLPVLLLLSALSYSQKVDTLPDGSYIIWHPDSTQIKLQQYKDMFTNGLITASEYESLKEKLLGIQPKQPTPIIIQSTPTYHLPKLSGPEIEALRREGNSGLGVGIFFIIGANACWISDAILVPQRGFTVGLICNTVMGIVVTGFGVGLTVKGANAKRKYSRYMNQASLNIKSNSIGLAYAF